MYSIILIQYPKNRCLKAKKIIQEISLIRLIPELVGYLYDGGTHNEQINYILVIPKFNQKYNADILKFDDNKIIWNEINIQEQDNKPLGFNDHFQLKKNTDIQKNGYNYFNRHKFNKINKKDDLKECIQFYKKINISDFNFQSVSLILQTVQNKNFTLQQIEITNIQEIKKKIDKNAFIQIKNETFIPQLLEVYQIKEDQIISLQNNQFQLLKLCQNNYNNVIPLYDIIKQSSCNLNDKDDKQQIACKQQNITFYQRNQIYFQKNLIKRSKITAQITLGYCPFQGLGYNMNNLYLQNPQRALCVLQGSTLGYYSYIYIYLYNEQTYQNILAGMMHDIYCENYNKLNDLSQQMISIFYQQKIFELLCSFPQQKITKMINKYTDLYETQYKKLIQIIQKDYADLQLKQIAQQQIKNQIKTQHQKIVEKNQNNSQSQRNYQESIGSQVSQIGRDFEFDADEQNIIYRAYQSKSQLKKFSFKNFLLLALSFLAISVYPIANFIISLLFIKDYDMPQFQKQQRQSIEKKFMQSNVALKLLFNQKLSSNSRIYLIYGQFSYITHFKSKITNWVKSNGIQQIEIIYPFLGVLLFDTQAFIKNTLNGFILN
ncbi:hypothetical protein ABPG72_021037 [Tetrahymena utriculariae]